MRHATSLPAACPAGKARARVAGRRTARLAMALAVWAAASSGRAAAEAVAATTPAATSPAPAFVPPPDSAIPPGALGTAIRRGQAIFTDTPAHAAPFVGNALRCSNCHLDAGRLAGAAPLAQAYVAYPAFRRKTGRVETFSERLQGCFVYSMNGVAPPLGDPALVALEAYAFFLAKGAPTGAALAGRGYPPVPPPPLPRDAGRGAAVFAAKCALCHGADGAGQSGPGGRPVVPALWGAGSYNWGAGMSSVKNAAGFIKANMPLGAGGSLSDQEAWDVATFVDSRERPQDPRFTGDVATTRARFHGDDDSLYGQAMGGHVLGDGSVPAGRSEAPQGAAPP